MTAPLAINTATTRRQWDLPQAVDAYARRGIAGIAPWRDQVTSLGLDKAARLLRESGLAVTGYCRGGMFPAADAAGRRAAIDDNRRMIEEAAAIGAPVLVLVCGGLAPGSRDLAGAHAMVRDGIAGILPDARAAGVKLAIEPLHPVYAADRACINTLGHANDLCEALEPGGAQALGVAVDVYHVWWDPKLEAEIRRAGRERLLGFHLCDWLVPTADPLNDRGMMADGVVDLVTIARWMRDAGFRGMAEVEIFSEAWWARDGDSVLATCLDRARPVLDILAGAAS